MHPKGKRLKLRRGAKAVVVAPEGTVAFSDVPVGRPFYLTKTGTLRVGWIKTHKWAAQYDNWSNDSTYPDQEFPPEYRVFIC